MRVCAALLGVALGFAAAGQAQEQLSLFTEATGASVRFPNASHVYGGTFGVFDTKNVGPVALGADMRVMLANRGSTYGLHNNTALDMGQFGVRVAGSPKLLPVPVRPYVEALAGVAYWRGGVGIQREDGKHFTAQIVAGVDYTVWHNIAWRVAEVSYGRTGAKPGYIDPVTVSTGIVIVFP
jgi:hypothetical protein